MTALISSTKMNKFEEAKSKIDLENDDFDSLSKEFKGWVDEYYKAGGKRTGQSWLFTDGVIKEVSPFVNYDRKYQDQLNEVKFLCTLLVFIIDDIADHENDSHLLDELYKEISIKDYNSKENLGELSNFVIRLSSIINEKISVFPYFEDYKEILNFEINQIFNSMKFSALVGKYPYLITSQDYWTYFPCSMQMTLYSIFELMCSSRTISQEELRRIRDIILLGQKMARIGNWISTWEREVYEKDRTSLIFAYILESNILTIKNLEEDKEEDLVKKIKASEIEKRLYKDWESCKKELGQKVDCEGLITIKEFGKKIDRLLELQLITKS